MIFKGISPIHSSQRPSIKSITAVACAGVTRELQIAIKKLSTKKDRKSMRAGLILTKKIPSSKGPEIKDPVRDRVENDIKIEQLCRSTNKFCKGIVYLIE